MGGGGLGTPGRTAERMLTCLISHSSCLSVLVVFAEACRVTDQPSLFSPATQAPVSRGYDVDNGVTGRAQPDSRAERRTRPRRCDGTPLRPSDSDRGGGGGGRGGGRGGAERGVEARRPGPPGARRTRSTGAQPEPPRGRVPRRTDVVARPRSTARRSLSHISHTAQNAPPPLRHRPRARERILHTCRVLVQNDSVTPFGFAVPIMWVQTQTPPPPRRARSALPGNESRSSHSHSRTDRSWAWRPGTRPWACCRRTQAPSCCPM